MAVRVVVGAFLGIMTGLFIGNYASNFEVIGRAYVQLLAMCVYPYLIASLLNGLGKLKPDTAKRLFVNAWYIYLIAWGMILSAMIFLSFSFPTPKQPAVILASGQDKGIDLVPLLIPGNLFNVLVNNYVPAVVVFTVLYGVAMQRIERKETYLEVTEQIKIASVTIWNWVVRLAPIGVFALFASAAGTLSVREIGGLLLYIIVFLLGTFLFAFWILPAFISSITNVSYKRLMRELREALVLSVVTTLSVVSLPIITHAVEKFLTEEGISDEKLTDVIGTNISIAYPFAQLGNLTVVLFFFFSWFYYKYSLSITEVSLLPALGLISTIGSPTAVVDAVIFLSKIYRMPASVENLYVVTSTFTRYGQVVLSVMGFTFVTLLSTLSFYKKLHIKKTKLLLVLGSGVVIIGITVLFIRMIGPAILTEQSISNKMSTLPSDLTNGVKVVIYKSQKEIPRDATNPAQESRLFQVKHTNTLRVGYNSGISPFCYWNDRNQLVGYDIAFMYKLAKDIDANLEFIPFQWENLENDIVNHKFDIAVSGIYVTVDRLKIVTFSKPYFMTSLAILARSEVAQRLTTRKSLQDENLTVASFGSPFLTELTKKLFPNSKLVMISDCEELPRHPEIDLVVWSLAQAGTFARIHTGFSAVVPDYFQWPFLFAYMLPPDATYLRNYINYWIDLKQSEGFTQSQQRYWIDGIPTETPVQRWCVIRNVLHWVK